MRIKSPLFRGHSPILLALAAVGIAFLWPLINFMPYLSQGDHGLNFYAAWEASEGKVPYRDFFWCYGPLMPYYYALFLKIFGPGLQSLLLGKTLLILISGLLIYINLSFFVPAVFSVIATIWFWLFLKDFPYTFNHTGGIPVLLMIFWMAMRYGATSLPRYFYSGLFLIFALSLIKLNMGFAALFAFFIITILHHQNRKNTPGVFWAWFIIVPAGVIGIYALLVRDLPFYYVRQCLPYFGTYFNITGVGDATQKNMALNILVNGLELGKNIFSSPVHGAYALLIVAAAARSLWSWKNNRLNPEDKKTYLIAFVAAALFYGVCLHEFIVIGVFYQAFWSEPFKVLMMFGLLGFAARDLSKPRQIAATLVILFLFAVQIPSDSELYADYRAPSSRFRVAGTDLSIGNDPGWVQTVSETVQYLKNHLNPTESFWAIPYDPLYYPLARRSSPTREVNLLNVFLPPDEQHEIIARLKNNHVALVVQSNRDREPGISGINQNNAPILQKYLEDNFVVETQFGNWESRPFWWANHAVRILKRRLP